MTHTCLIFTRVFSAHTPPPAGCLPPLPSYNKYLQTYEAALKAQPVPAIARKYYEEDNPFLFDLFCTVSDSEEDSAEACAEGATERGGAAKGPASECPRQRPALKTLCVAVRLLAPALPRPLLHGLSQHAGFRRTFGLSPDFLPVA